MVQQKFAYPLDGVVDVGENLAGEVIPDEVALAADGEGEEQGQQRNPETAEDLAWSLSYLKREAFWTSFFASSFFPFRFFGHICQG